MKKLSILLGLAFIMLISYGQTEQQIRNNVKITGEVDITDSLKISVMKPRTGVSNAKFDGILVIGDRSPSGIQKLNVVDGGIKLDDAPNGSAGTIDFEGGEFYIHKSDGDSAIIGSGGESIWTESGDTAIYSGPAKSESFTDINHIDYYAGTDNQKLTAAMAAVDYIVIDRNLTISMSVSPPSGTTFEFKKGGKITAASGTFTGNNTTIINAENGYVVDNRITTAGTFNVTDAVYPEWFGGVGNGIADDYLGFSKAVNFAKLTTQKKFKGTTGKSYLITTYVLINVAGLDVDLNNSTIINNTGTSFLVASPAGNDYVNNASGLSLAKTAVKGVKRIYLTASVSGYAIGDYITITSDSIPYSLAWKPRVNEFNVVERVITADNSLFLVNPIEGYYDTEQDARIMKMNFITCSIRNGTITNTTARMADTLDNSAGFYLAGVRNFVIDNLKVFGMGSTGIGTTACYMGSITNCEVSVDRNSGMGYPLTLASQGVKVSNCNFFSSKVGVSVTNGYVVDGSDTVMVSGKLLQFDNCTFTGALNNTGNTGCLFLMHVGAYEATINNCNFIGGLYEWKGYNNWESGGTYATNSYATRYDVLYKCILGTGAGTKDPATDFLNTNWAIANYIVDGISIQSGRVTINDCVGTNIGGSFITFDDDYYKTVVADGITVNNGGLITTGNSGRYDEVVVKNAYVNYSSPIAIGKAITLNYTPEKYLFSNIKTHNIGGIYIQSQWSDTSLYVDNLSIVYDQTNLPQSGTLASYEYYPIYNQSQKLRYLSFGNLQLQNVVGGFLDNSALSGGDTLRMTVDFLDVQNFDGRLFYFLYRPVQLRINGGYVKGYYPYFSAAYTWVANYGSGYASAYISNTTFKNVDYVTVVGDGTLEYYYECGNKYNSAVVSGAVIRDNCWLGTAYKNITLGSYYLSGDGGNEGISVASTGAVTASGTLNSGAHISSNYFYSRAGTDIGRLYFGTGDNAGLIFDTHLELINAKGGADMRFTTYTTVPAAKTFMEADGNTGKVRIGNNIATGSSRTGLADLEIIGTMKQSNSTITDNDATPDVSTANIYTYTGSANAVTITDLDSPVVGAIYYLIGNSGTYTMTIADSGNFNLSAQWVGGVDDVLILYVQADNDYIEIGRVDN